MIVAAAVVPQPPALLAGMTGATQVPEIEAVRAAMQAAARFVAAQDAVVIGVVAATQPPQPVAAAILSELDVDLAELVTVSSAAPPEECVELGRALADRAPRVALLVAGDGSARRGPHAPGRQDERAEPFDAHVEAALASGDYAALLGLDPELATQLLVAGRAPWQVLAGACGDAGVRAELTYSAGPFGVYYAVAQWQIGTPGS